MSLSLDRPTHRPARTLRLLAAAAVLATLIPGAATAQQAPPPPPPGDDPVLVDRRLGEEEQIRRRLEWFLSTRGAGTSSASERNALRRAAVTLERGRYQARSRRGHERLLAGGLAAGAVGGVVGARASRRTVLRVGLRAGAVLALAGAGVALASSERWVPQERGALQQTARLLDAWG